MDNIKRNYHIEGEGFSFDIIPTKNPQDSKATQLICQKIDPLTDNFSLEMLNKAGGALLFIGGLFSNYPGNLWKNRKITTVKIEGETKVQAVTYQLFQREKSADKLKKIFKMIVESELHPENVSAKQAYSIFEALTSLKKIEPSHHYWNRELDVSEMDEEERQFYFLKQDTTALYWLYRAAEKGHEKALITLSKYSTMLEIESEYQNIQDQLPTEAQKEDYDALRKVIRDFLAKTPTQKR
ncbi:MAG: hypothetical protein K0S07_53 [Chlamydiales bacterium]|jgi:hypothetical protein|nr:hypothetical protein [Chlamydiales bacterium]